VDKLNKQVLEKLRRITCAQLIPLLCDHAKKDRDFTPVKNAHTERWYVRAAEHDFELLITGTKFFDSNADKGGGGAIDLTMHLFNIDFKHALKKLREKLPLDAHCA
jgi:hypothetical protein